MLEVLYEDNHVIIVNKKPGDIVQGDKTGDKTLADDVKDYIKEKYNKPGAVFLGTIHRLDRPVSGAIAFARTSKALTRMNKLFQEKKIQKTYWAYTQNKPSKTEGRLTHYLVKDSRLNKTKAHLKEVKDGKKSLLDFQIIEQSNKGALIEVSPLTGRPHQIRVQLASIGAIIKGDLKYGAPAANPDKSICLHSRKIEFIHPVSKETISVIAPIRNKDFWN